MNRRNSLASFLRPEDNQVPLKDTSGGISMFDPEEGGRRHD
jgi:hypothetical protein